MSFKVSQDPNASDPAKVGDRRKIINRNFNANVPESQVGIDRLGPEQENAQRSLAEKSHPLCDRTLVQQPVYQLPKVNNEVQRAAKFISLNKDLTSRQIEALTKSDDCTAILNLFLTKYKGAEILKKILSSLIDNNDAKSFSAISQALSKTHGGAEILKETIESFVRKEGGGDILKNLINQLVLRVDGGDPFSALRILVNDDKGRKILEETLSSLLGVDGDHLMVNSKKQMMLLAYVHVADSNKKFDPDLRQQVIKNFNGNVSIDEQQKFLNGLSEIDPLGDEISSFVKGCCKPATLAECTATNVFMLSSDKAYEILAAASNGVNAINNLIKKDGGSDILISLLAKSMVAKDINLSDVLYPLMDSKEILKGSLESLTEDPKSQMLLLASINVFDSSIAKNLQQEVIKNFNDKLSIAEQQEFLNGLPKVMPTVMKEISSFVREILATQVLENVISKAVDNISKIGKRTFLDARRFFGEIARGMAKECFDPDGKVNIASVEALWKILDKIELDREPFSKMVDAKYVKDQMYDVLCHLLFDGKLVAKLNKANAFTDVQIGAQGKEILNIMSPDKDNQLKPGEAILTSLFSPHRQHSLPTCTINSLINEEIHNHPGQLAKMYMRMMRPAKTSKKHGQMWDGSFYTPGGYVIHQSPIAYGHIVADFSSGGKGKDRLFRDIEALNISQTKKQIDRWKKESIDYSLLGKDKYTLNLPVCDLNDVFFANFFRATNFGDAVVTEEHYGTSFMYNNYENDDARLSPPIIFQPDGSNFETAIGELQKQAQTLKDSGAENLDVKYMRVSTRSLKGTVIAGITHSGHAENIVIDDLLKLNLGTMQNGDIHCIGDRNWGLSSSAKASRLAVRKNEKNKMNTGGEILPEYEFVTVAVTEKGANVKISQAILISIQPYVS